MFNNKIFLAFAIGNGLVGAFFGTLLAEKPEYFGLWGGIFNRIKESCLEWFKTPKSTIIR